ncbi:MAG: PorT family protein [Bacteroidetes bacterium]|nr:PorT family protein [Bacteroidota bacterium]
MKVRSIVFVLLVFSGFQLFAQVKPFRFGFKVAPVLSWISPDAENYEYDGVAAGFSWGFMADITLADNYFIKTGFSYDYLNGKLKFPFQKSSDTLGTMNRKYKLRYLEVPLTIKLRTHKFGKTVYFGEVGLGTAFKMKAKSNDAFLQENHSESVHWESDISSETAFIKESLIAGIGLEYYLDESTSLLFELAFSNSLSDILTGENTRFIDVQQNGFLYCFQLNVGVIF